ncbi:MAG: hypothetical protein EHM64_12990 [Ignavibacteriae bacterium]|nr:MAG: hypothetical protein EHM64_12990 [Ignavibacteriota bacterium]
MNNISLRQLAGVNRVLGVDLTDNCARVVELEERIIPLRKTQSRFIVRNHFTLEFNPADEWSNKADLLKQKLSELGSSTRSAATSIRSLGVKVVETIIPSGIHAIDEWISENQEKLLRIPLSSGRISHSVEILEQTDSGTRVEITFVRKDEIERYQSFFRAAGLELIVLGAGVRDACNVIMVENNIELKEAKFFFSAEDSINVTDFLHGRRIRSYQSTAPITQAHPEEAAVFISGEQCIELNFTGADVIQPLGLSPEYCLPVGLTLKALNPELSPTNFLPAEETSRITLNIHKSLFQRTVLLAGTLLIVLLIIPFALETYLNWRSNSLDELLLANGSSYTELKLLETQTRDLEKQLTESGSSVRSSHTSKLLHDIASASPEGLWLYKFKLDAATKGTSKLSLFGYTQQSEKVTDYLKNLNGLGYEAILVRSGSPQQNETVIPLRKDAVTFEITTLLKN